MPYPYKRTYSGRGLYTGHGAYSWKKLGRGLRRIGEIGGRAALDAAGPYGAAARSGMHAFGYRGMGAYTPTASNDLVVGSGASSIPRFRSSGNESGALTVSHTEYLGDVFGNELVPGSTTSTLPFVNQTYRLNPGLEETFPWLAQVAANFEEYEFTQLLFEFKTVLSDVSSSNGQVGTVVMATNYNPTNVSFTDKSSMMQYAHAVSGKATDGLVHGVECDPNKLSGSVGKYVRSRPVVAGEDLKTYDWGTFQLALTGTPSVVAEQPIGELWVTYSIVLRKPRLFTGRGSAISRFIAVSPHDVTLLRNCPLGITDTGSLSDCVLVGQQNNLPVDLYMRDGAIAANRLVYAIGKLHDGGGIRNTVAITDACVRMTLPATFAGILTVTITIEGSLPVLVGQGCISVSAPLFSGNIEQFADMYAAGNSSLVSDSPLWYTRTPLFANSVATNIGSTSISFRIKVSPASNGVDNSMVWRNTVGGAFDSPNQGFRMFDGTPLSEAGSIAYQGYMEIVESNGSFATSNLIPAPLFVNPLGTVVSPS